MQGQRADAESGNNHATHFLETRRHADDIGGEPCLAAQQRDRPQRIADMVGMERYGGLAFEVGEFKARAAVQPVADAAFARGDYTASLQALAALKAPVDAFFDGVMVNAEDPRLRANRLGLLARLHGAMNRIADLSRLAAG